MTQTLQSELREYLDRGETLLWVGKPKSGIVLRTADVFMIPFSLLWCGFIIFWFIGVSKSGVPDFLLLFVLIFIIFGLIVTFGRFIIDMKQRRNTIYGLTENRIIIKSGVFFKNIKSINIQTLSEIELSEKNDKTGTILIGPKNRSMVFGGGTNWWWGMNPQLELIQNARKVYNQIIEIQNRR